MDVFETITKNALAMEAELICQRRDFHKHAESGWFEMRTSSIIARKLTELGYEVLVGEDVCNREARMGVPEAEALEKSYQRAIEQGADPEFVEYTKHSMTGVIGILRRGEGPTVALRFDIDALGVIESTDPTHRPHAEGFASVNHGMMHACGHDGHATIGLGVAKILMDIKDSLHGTVKLIFQPAEEGVRGAKSIVAKGHLDDVDYFLGGHLTDKDADAPVQIIGGAYGALATCKYDVIYRGKASHAGGVPQNGRNALVAAASAVMNLYAIPRHSAGASRINVGTLNAGTGRNVIADVAKMEIEVRGETTEINRYMIEYAERILRTAAEMHGCSCEIKLMGAADSLASDLTLAQRVHTVCSEKLGMPVGEKPIVKAGGSEDISYMMNRVQEKGGQATFMRLMTPMSGPAHDRTYDFDEAVLVNSVKAYCGSVADIMA